MRRCCAMQCTNAQVGQLVYLPGEINLARVEFTLSWERQEGFLTRIGSASCSSSTGVKDCIPSGAIQSWMVNIPYDLSIVASQSYDAGAQAKAFIPSLHRRYHVFIKFPWTCDNHLITSSEEVKSLNLLNHAHSK
jgi:hypothetical protein